MCLLFVMGVVRLRGFRGTVCFRGITRPLAHVLHACSNVPSIPQRSQACCSWYSQQYYYVPRHVCAS